MTGNNVTLDVSTLQRPGPRCWAIEGIMPSRRITAFYGAPGVMKTYLAAFIDVSIASGIPFLGRAVESGPVLALDWELDIEEFARRAWEVSTGLGLDRPPKGLYYQQMRGSLSENRDVIQGEVDRLNIVLVSVDSFSIAGCADRDAAIEGMGFLADLGVTVAVFDHQARVQRLENYANKLPYGTLFKEAGARSVWQLDPAEDQPLNGINLLLRDQKSTFSAKREAIGIGFRFDADAVQVIAVDVARIASLAEKLPAPRRILNALAELTESTPDEIAAHTGLAKSSAKTWLSRLKRSGNVIDVAGVRKSDPHLWRLASTPTATPPGDVDAYNASTHQHLAPSTAVNVNQQLGVSTSDAPEHDAEVVLDFSEVEVPIGRAPRPRREASHD